MALFHHNNRGISYRIERAPFPFDLVLLQSSQLSMEAWNPIVAQLQGQPAAGGRILLCEWYDSQVQAEQLAEDLTRLLQSLALHSVRVVAMEEAVGIVTKAQRQTPNLFEDTLLFSKNPPKGEALEQAISEFCDL